MADAYAYDGGGAGDGSGPSEAGLVAACKRISSAKTKEALIKALKQLAPLLEAAPQDPDALGRGKADVPRALVGLVQQADKDVRLYLAVCVVHMLRIWAPDTPYPRDDDALESVLQVLLWVVNRLPNHTAPTFQLAVGVLQVFCQTSAYYLVCDSREEFELEWFRALLDCVTEANADVVEIYVRTILVGMLDDDSLASEGKVEALLACLASPAAEENPASAALARAVLRQREREVQPVLQRVLTRLLTSPLTANSGLCEQSYAIVAQLHDVTPQALLPVVPHLSDELSASDPSKRLEAVRLLGRLFGQRGGAAVAAEWEDVLLELLRRFVDEKPEVRLEMVSLGSKLVGAVPLERVRTKVVEGVLGRLLDTDEKVRIAAVKAACAIAASHPTAIPDSQGSPQAVGPSLEDVSVRMRDTKPGVRRVAASALFSLLRSRVAKGGLPGGEGLVWVPLRAVLCACSDLLMRQELEATVWRDGLLGPSAPPGLVARLWTLMWRQAQPSEARALMALVQVKALLQAEVLTFLEYRRMLAGADADERTALGPRLDAAARRAAQQLPEPAKAEQHLAALRSIRDNRVAASLIAALSPGARAAAAAKARQDALQRVGSKSALAEFLRQMLAYASPSLVPAEVAGALLDLAAGIPPAGGSAMREPTASRRRHRRRDSSDDSSGEGSDDSEGSESDGGQESDQDPESEQEEEEVEEEETGKGRRGAKKQQQKQQPKQNGAKAADKGAETAGEVGAETRAAAVALCQALSKAAGGLFAGQTERLVRLLQGPDEDLRTMAAQLAARAAQAAARLSPRGAAAGAAGAAAAAGAGASPQAPQGRSRAAAGEAATAAAAANAAAEAAAAAEALRAPLLEVAAGPVPKAARHAVLALRYLLGPTAAASDLAPLCARLANALVPKAAAKPEALAHVHALSAFGSALPDVLAPHAEALLSFVLNNLLHALLRPPAKAAAAAASKGSTKGPTAAAEPTVDQPGWEVAAKCGAIKALARALTPDLDNEVRTETARAAAALMDELESLMDVDTPPAWLPPDAHPEAAAAVRLSAAAALLRLVRRHDARLPRGTYCMAALVMQDPSTDVRRLFGMKLAKVVGLVSRQPHYHQLSAKLAAMLSLGAADPVDANKRCACVRLREWVGGRRKAVQQLITAAAADRAADGGSTLQEQPEMALPYLVYILAHHPDMPAVDAGEELLEALAPFQTMLQATLAPLLAPAQQGAGEAAASLPLLLKMLRHLTATEDAAPPEASATPQIRLLCSVAAELSVTLSCRLLGTDPRGLKERGLLDSPPGMVVLPAGLYKRPEEPPVRGVRYLPPGFKASLDEDYFELQTAPISTAAAAAAGAKRPRPRSKPAAAKAAAAAAAGASKKAPAAGRRGGGSRRNWGESDDGWGSDDDNGEPQRRSGAGGALGSPTTATAPSGRRSGAAAAGGGAGAGATERDAGSGSEMDAAGNAVSPAGSSGDAPSPPQQQQRAAPQRQQRGGTGRVAAAAPAGNQQTLTFAAGAAADASSPGPGSRRPGSGGPGSGPPARRGGRIGGGTAAAARAKAAIAAAAGNGARRSRRGRGGEEEEEEVMQISDKEEEEQDEEQGSMDVEGQGDTREEAEEEQAPARRGRPRGAAAVGAKRKGAAAEPGAAAAADGAARKRARGGAGNGAIAAEEVEATPEGSPAEGDSGGADADADADADNAAATDQTTPAKAAMRRGKTRGAAAAAAAAPKATAAAAAAAEAPQRRGRGRPRKEVVVEEEVPAPVAAHATRAGARGR